MTTKQPDSNVHRSRRWLIPTVLAAVCLTAAVFGYLIVPSNQPSAPPDAAPAKTSTDVPVDVTARYQDDGIIGEAWWQTLPVSVGAGDLPADSSCPDMRNWLRERGGVDRGWSEVAVTIRARKPAQVVIQSIRSQLESSTMPPAVHTLLCVPDAEPYMAREDLLRHDMGFLVDQDGYTSNLIGPDPQDNTISLGFGEIHELNLKAYARSCDCVWKIQLGLLVDGQSHQWQLSEAESGQPFRTVAAPQSPGDSAANVVWCAPDGRGRPTLPARRDCPIPVVYETPLY